MASRYIKIGFVSLALLYLAVSAAPDIDESSFTPGPPCPNGENYKDDCNTCWCNPVDGVSACTRMACIHTYLPDVCPNGPSYKQDCQYCICDPGSGHVACTSNDCKLETKNRCSHGEQWQEDCNQCWCDPDDGISACTTYDCTGSRIEDFEDK